MRFYGRAPKRVPFKHSTGCEAIEHEDDSYCNLDCWERHEAAYEAECERRYDYERENPREYREDD